MEKKILDWAEYENKAREAAAEGIVLLKNDHQVLPFSKGEKIAVFGRMQNHYYRSGTGSGGMVNVSRTVGILDALLEEREIQINQELITCYQDWEKEHPPVIGQGWGMDPWSQEEMQLSEHICAGAASVSDAALVIIGRTAGEDRDNENCPGAYQLSNIEEEMLALVRKHFAKMIVVLNVGNLIDMKFVEQYQPDAVLYVWQGGMIGGYGVADVLTGRVNPSGRLSDTIAREITDYPADRNFGSTTKDVYEEGIYVGYRYFETKAKEQVLYPFGFGLSYTSFSIEEGELELLPEKNGTGSGDQDGTEGRSEDRSDAGRIEVSVCVKNTGTCGGKEVVQAYVCPPQGKLSKASRCLIGFEKTKLLAPGESQQLRLYFDWKDLASYDDTGVTEHKSCWVCEAGLYQIYLGENVRSAVLCGSFEQKELKVLECLEPVLTPGQETQMEQRRMASLPAEIPYTGNRGFVLNDVAEQKISMDTFLAQLSDEDLACVIRGEGMGSSKVTPGTAAAFGGVSEALADYGIPCACCDDGPSGMRLDCGDLAFSLPNGTLLACTFNRELNRSLFEFLGIEMVKNKVDCLLGPGMNIHRHPLNGRNFEYFSEDPYLTGEIGRAQLLGLRDAGVAGTAKHFCANNQEASRRELDSVVSERAMREIYLRGFEKAVKQGQLQAVMTSYGKVNGCHTASLYDLTTTILRQEWGFDGIVMTDWWADMNWPGDAVSTQTNFAAMVQAQNDLYMVCPDGAQNGHGDNTLEALAAGQLTRGELQRCAGNICRFLLTTQAMQRLLGNETKIEVINAPAAEAAAAAKVEFQKVEQELVIPLDQIDTSAGSEYLFGLDLSDLGTYQIELTGKSDSGELAQIPVSVFFTAIPLGTLTWNGTGGAWVTKQITFTATTKYSVFKLRFGQGGLQLRDIKVTVHM